MFDREKIARYVEELPLLDPLNAGRILQTFRQGCLARSYIDPALRDSRKNWAGFDDPAAVEMRAAFGGRIHSVREAAVSLCRTPRALKQALRHALSSWDALTGEIDFDDLMLMHLLREAEPAVFAVIRKHWDGLAGSHLIDDARKDAREAFAGALGELKLSSERRAAVDQVIKNVFQTAEREIKPQGLQLKRYWMRFLTVPKIAANDLDQPVLRTILANDDEALIDLLESSQCWLVENFVRLVPGERQLRLLVPLIRRRVSENPEQWSVPGAWLTGSPPGMIPLWRMMGGTRSVVDGLDAKAICKELLDALHVSIGNLHLVNELEYYFVSPRDGDGMLYRNGLEEGRELVAKVRETVAELLVQTYKDQPQDLLRALRGSHQWTLVRVVWGPLRMNAKTLVGMPFETWPDLAPSVLAACELDPGLMLPQIAGLLVKESGRQHDERGVHRIWEFDSSQAVALFGSEHVVFRLFKDEIVIDGGAQDIVEAVRMVAAKRAGKS